MTISSPAFDLHVMLNRAARVAMQFGSNGATRDQIDTIVALARGSNYYNLGSLNRLSKADADRTIDFLIENGAEPEFRKSEDEIAAEAEQAISIAKDSAARKSAKSQDKDAKEARDAADAAKGAELVGQRVHNRFQKISGIVVSQQGNRVSVQFDGETQPKIVSTSFVTLGDLPA